MGKKIFIFLCLNTVISFSQSISGNILNEKEEGINHAVVLNLRTKQFVTTNENGFFKILAKKKDSLEITHISFLSLKISAYSSDKKIYLKRKYIEIDEVFISSKKRKIKYIKNKAKKGIYAFEKNSTFSFLINKKHQKKILLKELIIPIKFKNKLSRKGVWQVQLAVKNKKSKRIEFNPISDLHEVTIDSIKKNKNLVITFNKTIILKPDTDIFLISRRLVERKNENEEFSEEISLEPYIYGKQTKKLKSSFYKGIGDKGEWSEWSYFSSNIEISFKIKGELLNES